MSPAQAEGIQKSKTGCVTCRIRKVKCDEQKPSCRRCQSTGRKCDGYQSNIRISVLASLASPASTTLPLALSTTTNSFRTQTPLLPSYPRLISRGTSMPSIQQVRMLANTFTIKPPASLGAAYNTDISYESEAMATLHATSEPAVYHALVSVAALRNVFEQSTDPTTCCLHADSPGVAYGLVEYTNALGQLRARISSDGLAASQYSLLCCQMFISIELALDDFAAAVQHFTRGLRIMYGCGSRPYYNSLNMNDFEVITARAPGLPMVDVFVLKLFLTPCPDGLTNSFLSTSNGQVFINDLTVESTAVRQANIRLAFLVRSTLKLLGDVSTVSAKSTNLAQLTMDRLSILEDLRDWKRHFSNLTQAKDQATARVELGFAFSMFCCLSMQAIVTLVAQHPEQQLKRVEPIFEQLLQMGRRLTMIKQHISRFGRGSILDLDK